MVQSYATELIQLHKSFENKLESLDTRMRDSMRKLNFVFNLLRRNDFSRNESRKIIKAMDTKGIRHGHRQYIYHKNDNDRMSGLQDNQITKLLNELMTHLLDYTLLPGDTDSLWDWEIVPSDILTKYSSKAQVKGHYPSSKQSHHLNDDSKKVMKDYQQKMHDIEAMINRSLDR